MNIKKQQSFIDVYYYIHKYFVPLWERKWLVIGIFILGAIVAFLVSSLMKVEYKSRVTLFVEKPRSEYSKAGKEEFEPQTASRAYILSQGEKIGSRSFAMEVLNVLPDDAKADLSASSSASSQIAEKIDNVLPGDIFSASSQEMSDRELQIQRMLELQQRVHVNVQAKSAMIGAEAVSFEPQVAPAILQGYIDVYMAKNLEENKESVRAKMRFIATQRDKAYQEYVQAKQKMINFRKEFGIPGDFQQARDIEIQLELDRLESDLEMARERYRYMDDMYMDIQNQEAGIISNVKILEHPTLPASPSKSKINRIRLLIILVGLAFAVGIVLLLDFLRSPLRHSKDVETVSDLPVIGYMPRIRKE